MTDKEKDPAAVTGTPATNTAPKKKAKKDAPKVKKAKKKAGRPKGSKSKKTVKGVSFDAKIKEMKSIKKQIKKLERQFDKIKKSL